MEGKNLPWPISELLLKTDFFATSAPEHYGAHNVRPLHNVPFCPISASDSNFNPRNIQYISVFKIFTFLELEQN